MAQSRPPSSTGADHRDGDHGVIDSLRTTSIYASLSTLLFSEKFADMTIRCGGRDFKAHRAIVCTQSSFFDKAFTSNFKEAASQTIDLPEDDPDILERFLQFLYTGSYDDDVTPTWGKPSTTAMMTPEEIRDRLENPPGVNCARPVKEEKSSDEEAAPSMHETAEPDGSSAVVDDGAPPTMDHGDDDPEDKNYKPPDSTAEDPEPEEEYNEFYAESPHQSDSETTYRLYTLAASERTEALQTVNEVRNDLFVPLRLYFMADRYDVPALKLLARDRFYRAVELIWEHAECFPDVVDELYRCTSQTDIAMRDIVCRLVGNRIEDDEVRTKMRGVMSKHGDFAVGVMEYNIRFWRTRW